MPVVLESIGVQHLPAHWFDCWFLPEEQKVCMNLNCSRKSIQNAPSSGTCPQQRVCSGRSEALCSDNTDEVYMWGLKVWSEDLERVSWWFTGFHHLKAITYTMMAEDGAYTRGERGVAIGLFMAWIWCSVHLGWCWVCKLVSRFYKFWERGEKKKH